MYFYKLILSVCVAGVKREGKAEIKEGDFDIDFTSMFCPFATHNLTYQPEDFQKLSNLTTYNILNNKDIILNTLNKVLKRDMERIPATKASKFWFDVDNWS